MTLTNVRAEAAKLLGPFVTGTATSGSSTTQLECTSWPFKSTLAQNDLYQDYYLMRPNASATGDVSRIVGTYAANTGLFTPDQSYTNGPNGETFELHGHPIEPYTALKDIINEGAKRCFVNVEVSFTPTASDERQELTTLFPWLLDARWVYQAGILYPAEQRRQVDPFTVHPLRGIVTTNQPLIYFEWSPRGFVGTELIYLRCIKTAYAHVGPNNLALIGTLTNATNATPIVCTSVGHGLANNALIQITGVVGNTNANGHWQVTVIDTATFSLNGSGGNAAYVSGGAFYQDYGYLGTGFVDENSVEPVQDKWIAAAAAVTAWDRYGHLLEQTANQKVIRDATKAAAWFNELTEYYFQEPLRTLQPIHVWGPPRYGAGYGW